MNNTVYVGRGECVIAIGGETNDRVVRIPAGRDIHDLVRNSTNNRVYCANWLSDDVTIIDGQTNSVITTIEVGDRPCALVWNKLWKRRPISK